MLITKGKVPARSPVGLMNFSAGREIKQSHFAARRFHVARTLPISSSGEAEQVWGHWGEALYLNLSPMVCLKTLNTRQDLFLMACQCYTHLIQFTVREVKEMEENALALAIAYYSYYFCSIQCVNYVHCPDFLEHTYGIKQCNAFHYLTQHVTLDHKTNHKGQFSEIEIYTSPEIWINKLSIDVCFFRIGQYLVDTTIWKSGIWGCKKSKYWENRL